MANFIEEIIERDLKEGKISGIITRFPPEPNGYLHIGHAKSICLNYYGTAKKYNGKFYLRFDDTNPSKEDDEYVRSIIEDVAWLGAKPDAVFYASDYFEKMFEAACLLIEKGKAYVCSMTADEVRASRGSLTEGGAESPYRNRPKEENLRLFKEMRDGKFKDGEVVLRAKIDMKSPNINMRDPIIYRVLRATHHRQGDKWCIYPMYDFAHPIEDAIEHITHSICTLEFEDHRPLYDWVINECGFEPAPHQYEFARLSMERTIMSKRYLKKLVDTKFVDGWSDPRMPTIAGLRRRGYTPSAICEFCERIGVAKANSEVETAALQSCIRDEYNLTAHRAMAVLDPVKLEIINRDEHYCEQLNVEINPFNPEAGLRAITLSNQIYIERADFAVNPPPKYHRLTPNGMVRLKSGYIIECVGHEADKDGNVTLIKAKIVENTRSGEDNSGIKVKGVIHWVDAKNCVDIEARIYDNLIDAGDSEKLNENSLQVFKGKGEKILSELNVPFQFLRTGYFVRDSVKEGLVFNQTVSLKESSDKKNIAK